MPRLGPRRQTCPALHRLGTALEVMLRQRYTAMKFEVFNTGSIAVNSNVLASIAGVSQVLDTHDQHSQKSA